MAEQRPRRAVIYLRASVDPTGERLAVQRHRKECEKIAAARGWQVVAVYEDNGIGAFRKTARRPRYEEMREAYAAGQFDALLCWDLDRLTRQPRQLEDWIDAAEERGLAIVTANGEADLTTDGGRMYARIKASVARAESERKSARQQLAAQQRAERGRPPLGVRLTGYTTTGRTVPAEAALVEQMFGRFHAGDSLLGIAGWLNGAGVPARHGGGWSPSSVRTILTNPRYAGRAVYNGQSTGAAGTWEPVVPEWLFDAVTGKLADPRRRCQTGTHRRYLGSGLFACGICGSLVRSHTGYGVSRYRCPAGGHVSRTSASVDEFVLAVVRERLGRPDLAGLLSAPRSEAARQAAGEIARLRGRLVQVGNDYDAGLIDGQRYKTAAAKVRAQLAAAEAAQARLLAGSHVAGTLTAPDPAAAFDAAPLGVQRSVIAFFMTVALHPAPRGRHFDPASVGIGPPT